MKWIVVLLGLFSVQLSCAEGRQQVKGLWASDGSVLSVYEADDTLHGKIVALKDPVYTQAEDPEREGLARSGGLRTAAPREVARIGGGQR